MKVGVLDCNTNAGMSTAPGLIAHPHRVKFPFESSRSNESSRNSSDCNLLKNCIAVQVSHVGTEVVWRSMLTTIRVGVGVSERPPEKVTHKRSTASLTPEMTKL